MRWFCVEMYEYLRFYIHLVLKQQRIIVKCWALSRLNNPVLLNELTGKKVRQDTMKVSMYSCNFKLCSQFLRITHLFAAMVLINQ